MRAPLVEIHHGKLCGRRHGRTLAYRGIPFAAPPVGKLRYREPQPVEPWSGVRDARRFGPSPIQPPPGTLMLGRPLPFLPQRRSEDCLYLNVWTPGLEGRRPVMVWVYGGAFLIGSASTFLYDGRRLAEEDIVVVTLNYRLAAFGFLCAEGVPSNLGTRDQIAALEWVRENIAAFGGDPGNVTVFGESAGAMSIATLLATPRTRGLFGRAILQSGAAHNVSTASQAEDRARRFFAALEPGAEPAPFDLDRLQAFSTEDLLAAQLATLREGGPPAGPRLPWQPWVDGDLIPGPPLETIRRGSTAGVDVLFGTNLEEWKLFTAFARRSRKVDAAKLRRLAGQVLERVGGDPEAVDEMLEVYGAAHSGRAATPFEIWVALRSDELFRIPADQLADALAAGDADGGGRLYGYLFDFPAPAFPIAAGACHSIDLPFVFGTLRHPLMLPIFLGSPAAERLGRTVRRAWASFARDGIPQLWDQETEIEWPRWREETRRVARLGRGVRSVEAPFEAERRFWMELV